MTAFGFAQSFRCMRAMDGPAIAGAPAEPVDPPGAAAEPVPPPYGPDGCFGMTVETYRMFGLGMYAFVDSYAVRRAGEVQILAPEEVLILQRSGVLADPLPPQILMPHETTQGFNFWGLLGVGFILWFIGRMVWRSRRRVMEDPRWTDAE